MLTRQKFRRLLRKKNKAEEAIYQASQRTQRRKGNASPVDQHVVERASLVLNQIEQEIMQLEEEMTSGS